MTKEDKLRRMEHERSVWQKQEQTSISSTKSNKIQLNKKRQELNKKNSASNSLKEQDIYHGYH